MKRDRATGEAIEFEIRHAVFRMNTTVQLDTYPWRAALIAAALLIVGIVVGSSVALVVALGVSGILIVLELINTRDFVTCSRVVRQRGILGLHRLEIPLAEVETVEVVKPPFGTEMPSIRDLEVRSATQGVTFLGVSDAAEAQSRILALRALAGGRAA